MTKPSKQIVIYSPRGPPPCKNTLRAMSLCQYWVRMSTGIGRACTRSLKGHVISRGLDLVVVVGDAEPKKTSQIHLNLYVWKPFFFPWWVEVIINISVEMWNDRRHPTRYKILTKNFLISIRGFVQKSVISCYTFRSTRATSFLNVEKSICLQPYFVLWCYNNRRYPVSYVNWRKSFIYISR